MNATHLIRVGTRVVNLDRMTHGINLGYATAVYFGADENDCVLFHDADGIAVAAYLEEQAVDVLAWHARFECGKAEQAAIEAARTANLELLDHCTDEAGHAWEPVPPAGFRGFACVRCGAHDNSNNLYRTIDDWGGVKAAVS